MNITLSNVTLDLQYMTLNRSLRTSLIKFCFRKKEHEQKPANSLRIFQDLSLTINDGNRVGIVGLNGSGKTTFLRLITGVYEPTLGSVITKGKITALLSITNGSHPDLTGYETIKPQLLLMGRSKQEIKKLMPQIAEFSELKEFLNLPVKYYSAGMSMRLCFSIATSIKPEILIMDEWLSTGDLAFVQKAQARLNDFINKSRILILASHDLALIENICDKALWLQQGKLIDYDVSHKVVQAYKDSLSAGTVDSL